MTLQRVTSGLSGDDSYQDSASEGGHCAPHAKRCKLDRLPSGSVSEELRTVNSLVDRFAYTPDAKYIVFVMVGLPARGKSFVSMRLTRFLQWIGYSARVFNVGKHRRSSETGVQDAAYFDPTSSAAIARRDALAFEVMDEMMSWLLEGDALTSPTRFAVFDATNTTKDRRLSVANRLAAIRGVGVVFVESLCDDDAVLEANIALKLAKSPDYRSLDLAAARADLLQRVSHYEKVYEPLTEEAMIINGKSQNISYIKLVNFASHVVAHNIYGRVATTVLPYLMGLHIGSRPVWLARLPHSEVSAMSWRNEHSGTWPPPNHIRFSEQTLSERGSQFADALARFVRSRSQDAVVFCCTHSRGLQVADRLGGSRVRVNLNPQDRGACNGLSAAHVAEQQPEIWADPVTKRFPGGESLGDMLLRLMPTLIEIEQEMRPSLIVAPLSVLQVLYCYFTQRPVADAMKVDLPMHTVMEIRPDGGDFNQRQFAESEL